MVSGDNGEGGEDLGSIFGGRSYCSDNNSLQFFDALQEHTLEVFNLIRKLEMEFT